MIVDLAAAADDPDRLPHRVRVGPDLPALLTQDPRLRPLLDPEISLELAVSAIPPGPGAGWVQLSSRQALRGDRVATVATAGPPGREVEVSCFGDEHWQTELALVATATGRIVEASWCGDEHRQGESAPAATVAGPGSHQLAGLDEVELPLELVLAAGEALREGRGDLLDELVRQGDPADVIATRAQLVRLHTTVRARLLAVVVRAGPQPRCGWISWLHHGDGWRWLRPLRRDERAMVRLEVVGAPDLGRHVARLVAEVRGAA